MYFNSAEWRSHNKGRATRQKILAHLQQNPNATAIELSQHVGVKPQQIRRQLTNLRITGDLQICPQTPGRILISLTLSGFLLLSLAELVGATPLKSVQLTPRKQCPKTQQQNPKQQPQPQSHTKTPPQPKKPGAAVKSFGPTN